VTHPVTYGDQPAAQVINYEVDEKRPYPVVLYAPNIREQAGTCRVERDPNGALSVSPDFRIAFPIEDCVFYGSFIADDDGRASLQEVLLVVTGA
jgi:hypothetical protein